MNCSAAFKKKMFLCFGGGVLTLIVLALLWTWILISVVEPDWLDNPETSMIKRLSLGLGVPIAITVIGFSLIWGVVFPESKGVEPAAPSKQVLKKETEQEIARQRREYVLEIVSMGVTLDKYRQAALWKAIQQGHGSSSVRDFDPSHVPWTGIDKHGVSGGRAGSTLENAVSPTPMYWAAPAFFGGPPMLNPEMLPSPTITFPGLASVGETRSSGLSCNLFASADSALAERPDRLLERIFLFFDEHPDVAFVVVSSYDDSPTRDRYRAPGTPAQVKDGQYVLEMTDASAMFVLARRERVDAIRPFAFEDIDDDKVDMDTLNSLGVARRVFLAHNEVEESVPREDLKIGRTPTVAEWLPAAAAFSKRRDIYGKSFSLRHPLGNPAPPKDFKPTPWFPVPWNTKQLATFDRLPTLGFLHRPVFVPTIDENGLPLRRRDTRAAALAAGWQKALETLPEPERKKAPSRLVVATAGSSEQTIAMTSVLNEWTAQGGPQLDTSKPTQWINTDARLGNTGAATWFVQMAIGVLGSSREGGTSVAINLRDPSEASIVFISPPPQLVAADAGALKDRTVPAIDPANYSRP